MCSQHTSPAKSEPAWNGCSVCQGFFNGVDQFENDSIAQLLDYTLKQ